MEHTFSCKSTKLHERSEERGDEKDQGQNEGHQGKTMNNDPSCEQQERATTLAIQGMDLATKRNFPASIERFGMAAELSMSVPLLDMIASGIVAVGRCYQASGKTEEARDAYILVLNTVRHYSRVMSSDGADGDKEQGQRPAKRAKKMAEARKPPKFTPPLHVYLVALENLSALHFEANDRKNGILCLKRAVGLLRDALGQDSLDVARVQLVLGSRLLDAGRKSEAWKAYMDCLRIRRIRGGESHPHRLEAMARIVGDLLRKGHTTEAIMMLEEHVRLLRYFEKTDEGRRENPGPLVLVYESCRAGREAYQRGFRSQAMAQYGRALSMIATRTFTAGARARRGSHSSSAAAAATLLVRAASAISATLSHLRLEQMESNARASAEGRVGEAPSISSWTGGTLSSSVNIGLELTHLSDALRERDECRKDDGSAVEPECSPAA